LKDDAVLSAGFGLTSLLFMRGLAFSSLRVGERYRLINYGELFEFELISILDKDEFLLKDLFTLETYKMSQLIGFGKGDDLEIRML
jgi:hypothetical protein